MTSLPRLRKTLFLAGAVLAAGLGLSTILIVVPAFSEPEYSLTTTVWLDGPSEDIYVDEEITVTIRISDVVDLFAIEFTMAFSPSDLQVIDADPVMAGVQILPAECPEPDFIVVNSVNNSEGTISYAVSQLFPNPAFTGSCKAAHIRFVTLQAAETTIRFTSLILADEQGASINFVSEDLTLHIILAEDKLFLPFLVKP